MPSDKPHEPKKQTLTVVVNGDPVKVKESVVSPLEAIIPEALKDAKVTGRPPED